MLAQGGVDNPNRITQQSEIGPLEVIRNIDLLFGPTRIEATQAGRGKALNDKVNIAKSFVHASQIEKARLSYQEAVYIAWNRGEQAPLIADINEELDRIDRDLIKETRPEGLDENFQPIDPDKEPAPAPLKPMDKNTAGNKIDAALSFLYTDILRTKPRSLCSKGVWQIVGTS